MHLAAAEQLAQLLANLIADAIRPMILRHYRRNSISSSRDQSWFDAVDFIGGRRQRLFDVIVGRRDGDDAERCALPEVLMLDLGNGDVELLQAILHAPKHHSFVLQRLQIRQVHVDVEYPRFP